MKQLSQIFLVCTLMSLIVGCDKKPNFDLEKDQHEVERILADLDNQLLTPEQQLENYMPEAVILAPNQKEVRGQKQLYTHLSEFGKIDDITIKHQIVELESFEDIVVLQGKVVGLVKPEGGVKQYPFETKNIILLKRRNDETLKIWKVIYNASPNATGL